MITKEEILRLAYERGACKDGLEWYEERSREDILTWEAITEGYFGWVAKNIPEAIPYLQTMSEELKEKSLNSKRFDFKLSMALIGYKLEVLKDDPDWYIRREVAKQGYALEQFKDDFAWGARWEVASQGYALEQLKDDPHWAVRRAVAYQGYALEQLKDDPDKYVRDTAKRKLKEISNEKSTFESSK